MRPTLRAVGPTATARLAATGEHSIESAIRAVLAASSPRGMRAFSLVERPSALIWAHDGARITRPACTETLLYDDADGRVVYARIVVPAWGRDETLGPFDDAQQAGQALDAVYRADLAALKAHLPVPALSTSELVLQ